MSNVLKRMIKIYEPNGVDWMGFRLSKKNPYTYHHIREKRNGGKATIQNGCILTKNAHQFLNTLDLICPKAYDDYQHIFRKINKSQQPISDELLEDIYGMLLDLFYYNSYRFNKHYRNIEESQFKCYQKIKS